MADEAQRNEIGTPSQQPRGPTPSDQGGAEGTSRPSDWGSLVADLGSANDRQVNWHIHDRTHLEFAVDYRMSGAKEDVYEWETYFFIPTSLRVERASYSKDDIYSDLRSYVRYTVPDVPFRELSEAPLDRVAKAIDRKDDPKISREMRLFACQVRASSLRAKRAIVDALEDGGPDLRSTGLAAAARLAADVGHVTSDLRAVLARIDTGDPDVPIASRWIDEDISRVLETVLGALSVELEKQDAPKQLQKAVIEAAVAEARYRRDAGLEGVGRAGATKGEVEHLEFRRNVLKRFSSSVLWLKPEVKAGARWALQVLYALAAGLAMAFAIFAAFLNGFQFDSENAVLWISLAILAYMAKDRLKAILQNVFDRWADERYPDRRWRIHDEERRLKIGEVDEQTGFVNFEDCPPAVRAQRLATRRHPIERQARPERVLRHKKSVRLRFDHVGDERFEALTEIFRLDLRRWLAHTDDPKREILFADPDEGRVCSAMAPRVYNIGVVYRLHRAGDEDAEWKRIRVVVSRKGIRRVDHITAEMIANGTV